MDSNLVSVMMPFNPEFKESFAAIAAAAYAAGLKCQRADDIWEHETVIQDIFSLIFRSRIVVCDFTQRNPNVFYEAGIAHTLGKYVVPITQSPDDVPFDLRHHRYIRYLNNGEGLIKLQKDLTSRLCTLAGTTPSMFNVKASVFNIGVRVYHKKFGKGIVIGVAGSVVTVDFSNFGRKRIIDQFFEGNSPAQTGT